MKRIIIAVAKILEHNPEHSTMVTIFDEKIQMCSRCLGMYTSGLICYFLFAYIYLYTDIKLSFFVVITTSFILGSITLIDWVTVDMFHKRKGNNKIRITAGVLLGVAGMLYFWLLPESWLFRILTLILYNLIAIFIALVAIRRNKIAKAQTDNGSRGKTTQ